MTIKQAISAPPAEAHVVDTGPTQRGAFIEGMRDTFPLIVGATPFGIIFGAVAVTGGLSPLATMALSLIVFAGSAQFIAVGLITQGTGTLLIILTTFIVNLRHALYSASIGPYMRHLSQRWLLPLGFLLTDETYAVVFRRWHDYQPHPEWYQLGSSVAMYTNWQVWTFVGIVAGTQLDGIEAWGLDFAMVVTFIGIVVPLLVTRPMVLCAVVAGIVAVVANDLPNNLGLMVAALAGIVAGVLAEGLQSGTVVAGIDNHEAHEHATTPGEV